ncbi:adult-specific rigid cuticular protein 15.7-like [Limulus polyphemus]|uniref:Adult-specific rigid cuticular protein 15.7-like n=1 Tax=Limulus polyphemus TaxID=6850 RepID=A0ABM1BS65_LIMPO|nr:adult-specific rigid cuticular protein 15.7-like [Limulus polyphemus]
MLKIAVLLAVVAVARGGFIHGAAGGVSTTSRSQDDFGNYRFNYHITDPLGASNSRWEAGDAHGNQVGSYTIRDIDGRARNVNYVADGAGFRAKIHTNEQGTATSLPAAAAVVSSQPGIPAVGPATVRVAHAAPVAAVAAAPVAAFAAPAVAAVAHGPAVGFGGYGLGYGLGGGFGVGGYGLGHGYGIGGYGLGHGYGVGGYGLGLGLGHLGALAHH